MTRLDWRFRKRSESDPILSLPCGCRYDCYSDTVVRYCNAHLEQQKAEGRALKRKELKKNK